MTNCFLTCVDDRLTTIWEKPFGTNGTKVEALLAVNNNRYAALIWTSDGQHLILLDDAGNLIDDLQVSGNTNDGYYGLGLTNQGNIIMAGSFEDRGKVLVTDLNGVVLDSVVNSSSTKEKLAALAVASSGDIMAVGWKENQTGIRQVLLVKIRTSY